MRRHDTELRKNCSAYGSIIPVSGCCPWLHGGSSESMALREGGMIIEAWPSAPAASEAKRVNFIARCWRRAWSSGELHDGGGVARVA